MALSIVVVVILYVTIGHIGPTFSSDVMTLQRGKLREHYGLAREPIITNLKTLQIPPSERSLAPSIYYGSSKWFKRPTASHTKPRNQNVSSSLPSILRESEFCDAIGGYFVIVGSFQVS
jgi:hypothetical protein